MKNENFVTWRWPTVKPDFWWRKSFAVTWRWTTETWFLMAEIICSKLCLLLSQLHDWTTMFDVLEYECWLPKFEMHVAQHIKNLNSIKWREELSLETWRNGTNGQCCVQELSKLAFGKHLQTPERHKDLLRGKISRNQSFSVRRCSTESTLFVYLYFSIFQILLVFKSYLPMPLSLC